MNDTINHKLQKMKNSFLKKKKKKKEKQVLFFLFVCLYHSG